MYRLFVVLKKKDVLDGLLEFLRNLNVFATIFSYDPGSKAKTFAMAQKNKGILHEPKILNKVFTDKVTFDLLAKHQNVLLIKPFLNHYNMSSIFTMGCGKMEGLVRMQNIILNAYMKN